MSSSEQTDSHHLPESGPTYNVKGGKTYRVRYVPNHWTRHALQSFLVERDPYAKPDIKSLASEVDGHSQMATVSFQHNSYLPLRIPLVTPSGQFDELRNLVLDDGFLGITTLFAPPPHNHEVDIIGISGLNGHAFGSFKERGGEHMWLRDTLPNGITSGDRKRIARIMIYGFNSRLVNSDSFENLEDLSTTFHSHIRTITYDDSFKPIVFIAHSLGGLIVKQFLISLSKSNDEVDQKLKRMIYGIAFFGVPHDGIDIRSLIPMVGDGINRFLLESIGSINSQILSIQKREFSEALGSQGESQIISFYETRVSPTALQNESGIWSMSGEPAVLVSKASATYCRPWEKGTEYICAINRTHSEMIKFAEGDPEYDMVLGRIKSLVWHAIKARRSALQPSLSQEEQACLQSLAFCQMQDRGNDIEHAIQGTCQWLITHDTYITWAFFPRNILWIKGKPGAGKSTLLKYALNKQRDILGAKENDLVICFFFHGRGNALQKTPLGFLRSILHQILKQVPKALSDLVSAYQQKRRDMGDPPEKWQWHAEELWHFFKSSLPKILADRSIWLFVDALDECGEADAKQLVQRFVSLAKSTPLSQWTHFHICFSCRHYPILSTPGLFEICLEEENKSDILTYVQSELKLSSFEEPTPSAIQNLIIIRASGVFLWARLVVKQVQDLELDGAGANKIKAVIHTIPEGLYDLYLKLISDMEASSIKLVQWICFAMRPLSTEELRWALLVMDARSFSLQHCQNSEDYIPDSKRMNQQVIKLSRGLAEVASGSDIQVVQFIHQSVKDFFTDFFINRYFNAFDYVSSSTNISIGIAHFELLRACIIYLRMEEIRDAINRGDGRLKEEYPFLHYAATSWISHAQQSDDFGDRQYTLQKLFLWPSNDITDLWTCIMKNITDSSFDCPPAGTTLVHVAARYCILGLLGDMLGSLNPTPVFDSKEKDGWTPLLWAAKKGHATVAMLLLNAGAGADLKDKDGRTPLSWAAGNGHKAVVRQLLNRRAEVDSKEKYGRTPLSHAAENGHEAITGILLHAGADVNSTDNKYSRAALSWAARNGHEGVAGLLLNALAEIESKDEEGWTPLLRAAAHGHDGVVKLLLDARAEVNFQNKSGQTPLLWAAANGHESVVKLLLNSGAAVNLQNIYNQTPMSWAVANGHESVTKLLLDSGAEVNSQDMHGQIPLLPAAENRGEGVTKILFNSGSIR